MIWLKASGIRICEKGLSGKTLNIDQLNTGFRMHSYNWHTDGGCRMTVSPRPLSLYIPQTLLTNQATGSTLV